jgi:hypothetical protein
VTVERRVVEACIYIVELCSGVNSMRAITIILAFSTIY